MSETPRTINGVIQGKLMGYPYQLVEGTVVIGHYKSKRIAELTAQQVQTATVKCVG